MRHSRITIFLLSVVAAFAVLSSFDSDVFPGDHVQDTLMANIDTVGNAIDAFEAALESDDPLAAYRFMRLRYKRIETYVGFRYPALDKAINGGPVPSIETEIVILHKDDPHGLQVIEEMLDAGAKETIQKEIQRLKKQHQKLRDAFARIPLLDWEILEANHMALSRLMTLSLSGFDSPVFLLSLEDAEVVLNQIGADLGHYASIRTDRHLKRINESIHQASNILSESEFDNLNRFELYRDILIPLQAEIKNLHKASGFESYGEASEINRSIAQGSHLYAKDYLDPLFSMRGNVKSSNKNQVELGKVLFYDPVLSGNFERSCASCHKPNMAYADGLKGSPNYNQDGRIKRNTPGLINVAFQSNFFYDLRSKDMNDQIMHVLNSPDELNISQEEIVARLSSSKAYKKMFDEAYPGFEQSISLATVKSALELYVRSLIASNSKFDQNIRNEKRDFTPIELQGANLFFGKAACATCHFPPHFNGFVPPHYQDTEGEILGVLIHPDSNVLDTDAGVFERFQYAYPSANFVNGMFKTSTVRNIELTAPYMHNGAFETLEQVVGFYNHGGAAGRGVDLPQQTLASDSLHLNVEEQAALVSFMKTLTDTTGTNQTFFALPKLGNGYPDRIWGGTY